MASRAGLVVNNRFLTRPYAPEHVAKLLSPDVKVADIDKMVEDYCKLDEDCLKARECKVPGVLINCVCPGSVNTSMWQGKGLKTVSDGADTPLYLANLPVGATEPNGAFYAERKPIVQKA